MTLPETDLNARVHNILADRGNATPSAALAPTMEAVAGMIDHTLLKPEADSDQIRELCSQALDYHFAAVCINPCWVSVCASLLDGSDVKVATTIGFPLGATLPEVKAFESERSVAAGASELDMVLNIGVLRSRRYDVVEDDIAAVVAVARRAARKVTVKVIIETCLLSDEQKVQACLLAQSAGADFVKTSTGFSTAGATAADVALMRRTVGPGMGVKAAGGVRSAADALAMIAAGANRIGTSAGVKIINELRGESRS